ncbi:glycosyl transferase, group 1 [Rhodopirellula sallentina SM41]|uniref:Glycosyl transferase, group 1 n=1 Tax=Rhodopirellula sallentina SM41 TaxID=1263870 RepID=M5U5D4_9BACT|nr:glycosyl transferase, group 1 [Rhodopirellula sallentina SM41]
MRFLSRTAAQWQGSAWCGNAVSKCDVVHFVGTGWDLVGFPLLQAAREQKKLATCWPAVHPRQWGDAPLDIDLYRKMDGVFVQSDYEGKHLREKGVSASVLVRCGCAAPDNYPGDADRFRKEHELGDRKVILFVGRKSNAKGYHALRNAVAELNHAGTPVTLVSIGRDLEPPYPSLPKEVDLDLGAAEDAVKHDALAACDVFALPSEAESFGIVYVEAWAYGKPVICGAAPASQELVNRHRGGISTDGSVGEVKKAIANILATPAEAETLGRSGLNAVCAEYTAERIFERHFEVWNRRVGEQTPLNRAVI